MKYLFAPLLAVVVLGSSPSSAALAQSPSAAPSPAMNGAAKGVAVPPGYVIGPEDVLSVVFWKDKELSADVVVVRPDGRISLPLLNDVPAAGLTPDQLRSEVLKAASKFIEDPNATVVVKEIHSRKVFISGMVGKPGAYNVFGHKTVAQLIAEAGGLIDYADSKNIVIVRENAGRTERFKFNYKDFTKGTNVEQNIALKPGDTVIVP